MVEPKWREVSRLSCLSPTHTDKCSNKEVALISSSTAFLILKAAPHPRFNVEERSGPQNCSTSVTLSSCAFTSSGENGPSWDVVGRGVTEESTWGEDRHCHLCCSSGPESCSTVTASWLNSMSHPRPTHPLPKTATSHKLPFGQPAAEHWPEAVWQAGAKVLGSGRLNP